MYNFGKRMWRQKNMENVLIGPHTMNIVGAVPLLRIPVSLCTARIARPL